MFSNLLNKFNKDNKTNIPVFAFPGLPIFQLFALRFAAREGLEVTRGNTQKFAQAAQQSEAFWLEKSFGFFNK